MTSGQPLSPRRPHWDDLPIALLDGQRVRTVSAAGGRARIRAGMTIAEARSRCAELRVAMWDDAMIGHAVTEVTARCVQASPQVTPVTGAPGLWWVGASGLESLGGETALGQRLLTIARRWHPGARVGIADSCVAARAATWEHGARASGVGHRTDGVVIVPPGACAAYLAVAPLGIVPMDEELRETLHALGLRTVGGFAALDGEDVERRWGDTGLAAWRLARGEDRRRPVLARLDAPRSVTAELTPSVPTMEPVLFLVRAALERLVPALVADGRAAVVVAITLTLDEPQGAMPNVGRAHTITREVRLPRAVARTIPLLERCRALLDQWTLTAPVCGVTVAVTATAPLAGEQGDLLDTGWRDPAAADAAFARIRSTLGSGAIVRPVVRDTHRPEQAGGWDIAGDAMSAERPAIVPLRPGAEHPLAAELTAEPRPVHPGMLACNEGCHPALPGPPPSPTPDQPHGALRTRPTISSIESLDRPLTLVQDQSLGTLPALHPVSATRAISEQPPLAPLTTRRPALRQLDPPEPVDVTCDHDTPRAVHWRGRWIPVARAIGPERLAGDWWHDHYARDYWRCEETSGTGELMLYRDLSSSGDRRWYVHGWSD